MDETASVRSSSQALTAGSAGTKRKKTGEPKFYAVRVGHAPGIYHTWHECLEQVTGFKGAICKAITIASEVSWGTDVQTSVKSFPSLTDAERFIAGDNAAGAGAENKFYAVKSGRVPGIYTDWESASAQIKGWTKPRHKLFQTRAEAQQFLEEDDGISSRATETVETNGGAIEDDQDEEETAGGTSKPPPAKKAKRAVNGASKTTKPAPLEYNEADYEPGTGPLPAGAEDGFDPNIRLDPESGKIIYKSQEQRQATKAVHNGTGLTGPVRIHTDGSSLGNGKAGAFAGIGVYFGPNDERYMAHPPTPVTQRPSSRYESTAKFVISRNVSEALPGTRQTNQRAELTAVLRALELVPRNRDCQIITDSQYAINCCTTWFINWRQNNWKTSSGKPVENKDLVENILGRIEERQRLGVKTEFEWIKGHAQNEGNVAADKLAVDGARKAASA